MSLLITVCGQSTAEQASPLVGMRRIQSAHASRLSRGSGSASSLADTRRARSALQSRNKNNGASPRFERFLPRDAL